METAVKHMSEEMLQSKCFQWFWNTYPLLRRTLFAVPNGGHRDKREANRLKATGVVAGVSDLIWVLPNRVIFIEMKTVIGIQSEEQTAFQAQVEARGHMYVILRTVEAFQAYVICVLALYK